MLFKTNVLDEIVIDRLRVRGILGLNEEERQAKQDYFITLHLSADLSDAGKSDDIRDTVDYRWIHDGVIAMAEASRDYLLEHLASKVAVFCLEHVRIQAVKVRIDKPGILRHADNVSVSITRQKSGS
jgi:FolB domain-containing protein